MVKFPLALMPIVRVSNGQAQLPPPGGMVLDATYASPAEVAQAWIEQGATWLHVIDMDAVAGSGDNLAALTGIRGVHFQIQGGIHSDDRLAAALRTGANRVVVDYLDAAWVTTAIAEHGDKVAVGLDIHEPELMGRLSEMEAVGAARYVVTDSGRHSHWTHEDRVALREFCQSTPRPVLAEGGINHLDDLHELHELVPEGLEGILIGTALYDGAFSLAEAAAASADRFDLFFWGPPQP